MNASNSSSKSATRFTIDFIDKKIIGAKASFNKAGKGFGPEYEELAAKVAAHPDFALVVKEPKHKSTTAKRSYDGMDFPFMESYIGILENADALLREYTAVKKMAKDAGAKAYPLTKKWFIQQFSTKEDGFDMEAAKEAIAQFRISQAQKMAAGEFSLVPAAAAEAQTEAAA